MNGTRGVPLSQLPSLQLQMGSMSGKSMHEFEDESLASPMAFPTERPQHHSIAVQELNFENLKRRLIKNLKIVIFTERINILMPCGPAAIIVNHLTAHHGWVFMLSLLGIIPLAERLGFATEQLVFFTGPTVGGLLNATFGNATELIISIFALENGMIRIVQQSLLGSILSNMLLVLGCAFFAGGLVFNNKEQVFDKSAAVMNSGLLLMGVMGLLSPAVLYYTHTELHFGKSELALSRFTSFIMLVVYASYIFYQLKNQKASYDHENEGASIALRIPIAFISVILLPIVGNAAEHASAIMFAMKDKLDISLGVAIGSSTQITMFGIPFCVIIGWIMGTPMDLNFQLFETATLFITVIVVAFMLQDGTSNYFKGLMLILCYLIVAASFYVHVDPQSVGVPPGE
ncbi:hypothetical protein J5N97_026646 [Dioscorea zingiberensis]|uniref:Sodium/calcium exchanger membrane region domain-containing protein n=1 Tax=Dioscorea zingiberensis TaxID=325984 RepID=A0A9D5H6W1_9LILI|nr:hypothetical protein J5N97_026646 [Dioscorea zingiberensis]